jgi:hypothetical protein
MFHASPSSSEVPRSSASLSSVFPPKESKPRAQNHRRHCRFPCRLPSSAASNSLPLALLQPPHLCLPSKLLVQVDPSCAPSACPSAASSWSPLATGAREEWSRWVFDPVDLASVACLMCLGAHRSVSVGQVTLGAKSLLSYF